MCALLIDVVLVGFVTHLLDNPAIHFTQSFLFWLAAYGAVLWKLKGSTVGDTVLHLKVVRIDDRPTIGVRPACAPSAALSPSLPWASALYGSPSIYRSRPGMTRSPERSSSS